MSKNNELGERGGVLAEVASSFAEAVPLVDARIGEKNDYGAGIGPHDEPDQIGAIVDAVRTQSSFAGTISTDPSDTRYPASGQDADLYVETPSVSIFVEAKLFRFKYGKSGQGAPSAFAKVFSPFQRDEGRSFLLDVPKLARMEANVPKGFLAIYYRPVEGTDGDPAGSEITGEQIAVKFREDVALWTDHEIETVAIEQFGCLQHEYHQRGAVLAWMLEKEPVDWFGSVDGSRPPNRRI